MPPVPPSELPPPPLRERELRRLVRLFDEIADGLVVFDADWRFVWVNAAGAALLECDREKLIGRSLWEEFPGSRETAVHDEYHRAVREQREVCFQLYYPPLSGWFEVRAMPAGDGLVATYRDITAQRRSQALLGGNREILALIAQDAPLPRVLDAITGMVEAQSQDGALASILLSSDDGLRLCHGSAPSLPDFYNAAIDGVEIGPAVGSCGTAAHRGAQVVVSDIAADPLWQDFRQVAQEAGLRACWSTPIFSAGGELLGTFAIYYRQPRYPGPDEQSLIEQVTRTAAIAIRHDRDRRLLREAAAAAATEAARSRRLQGLAARLAVAVDATAVAQTSIEYALEAVGGQGGWLAVLEDSGRLEATYAHGLPARAAERLRGVAADPDTALSEIIRSGRPRWLGSRAEIAAEFPVFSAAHSTACALGVLPLRAGNRTAGVLMLSRDRDGDFLPDAQEEAGAVAAQCGQALARARRFTVTHQLVEVFQRSVLTAPPTMPGLDVAARYHPAVSAAGVGGDWYDAFPLPGGELAVVIGDVVGHDLAAAATMAQLRSMLRGLACDHPGEPGDVLRRLDELSSHLAITDFTTLVFAVVSGGRGVPRELRWANAGHPPPLLFSVEGDARTLDAPAGLVLGVQPDHRRASGTIPLPAGSTVLLYTDGLVETRTDPLDARLDALCTHAAEQVSRPLEAFCDAVLRFAPEPEDDVALLALRVTGD